MNAYIPDSQKSTSTNPRQFPWQFITTFINLIFSKTIGNSRIGSMFIPGTHNSGSFIGAPSFLQNYVLNQDRSVWTQLVFGIRYLDFRIGYYGKNG